MKKANTKIGKVCVKHPELMGLRYSPSCLCIACISQKNKRRSEEKKAKHRRYQARWARMVDAEAKRLVVEHYNNKCELCDVNDIDMLTVDHIDGGGAAHRKELGRKRIYRWLVDNNFPQGYRLLCANHNLKAHIVAMRMAWEERHGGKADD